jgi:hypothetical protein
MKYIVGINQKTKLYTARFLFSSGCLIYSTHNVVKGIADHNTKPMASGIYGHKTLLVEVLWNILSLYPTLLALDIRYGDEIRIASSRKTPPGIKSNTPCVINTEIGGSVKNIKFQKLSLFNRALIKSRIIAPNFIYILHFYDTDGLLKKLCFFRVCAGFVNELVQFLKNSCSKCSGSFLLKNPLRIVNIINNVIGNSRLYHKMK